MAKSFGVTSTGGYGVLQTLSEGSSAEKAQARGVSGKVEDEVAYSVMQRASAEFIEDTGSASDPTKAGTSLQIGSLTALIVDIEAQEENTGYKRGTVSIEVPDGATQAPYA